MEKSYLEPSIQLLYVLELQCGNAIKTDKIKDLHLDVNAKESRPRQTAVPVAITNSKDL